ncbi:MAG TPA: hypothetical protein VFP14_01170 [Novosphingobium sp.]|nr:hypothetical protein [Novosphingobium sp.]
MNSGGVISLMNSNSHRIDLAQAPQRGTGRRGIVAHRFYPAVVALWLATILAIGSMAMPVRLLEGAAAALQLDVLVPAARPPLGFTARLLVSFVLALSGGGAGYLAAQAQRRRTLRLPDRVLRARPEPIAAESTEPTRSEALRQPDPAGDDEDLVRLAAALGSQPSRRRALTSETAEASPPVLEISALPALEPLKPSVREPNLPAPDLAPEAEPVEPAVMAAPSVVQPAGPVFRTAAELGGEAAMRLCAAPLESLGLVQLVERFTIALQARRLRNSATVSPEAGAAAAPPAGDEWGELDEDPVLDPAAARAYPSLTDVRPATRQPAPLADFVRIEDGADENRLEAGPQPVVIFPGQAVAAPPVTLPLPGTAGAARTQDTEQALREALAALQRMSGAA